jgi:2-keto-4-pentenoate hydratase/2-oxohepta-3-ene-1,7-dioic acid hydratase in catechol pathway
MTTPDSGYDVATASGGEFGPGIDELYGRWESFRNWASGAGPQESVAVRRDQLGSPSPSPRQVFAVGANYGKHVAETGRDIPKDLAIFTKFPSCIIGPYDSVIIRSDYVDWETELVVVMGRPAQDVQEADAWSYAAGVTVGQDLSERILQRTSPRNQYCLPKSMPGFGPTGPHLVTIDELANPGDLELSCTVNGDTQQQARTSDMVFSVPQIIARLSELCRLLPGDLIFTGTPAGVGGAQDPPRYLRDGDVLVSHIEGIGDMENRFVDQGKRITYRS